MSSLLWLAVTFPVLLLMEGWIHRQLQRVIFLITGSQQASVYIYALVLLPGVFLHELSHYVTAKLLLVRTGRFSLVPAVQADGSLRLGFVEFYRGRVPMPIRESVIGGAPFIFGTAAVWGIGRFILQIPAQPDSPEAMLALLRGAAQTPDFYLWLYLLFAISNSMLPSPSDRQAWPFLLLTLGLTGAGVYFLGMGDDLLLELRQPLTRLFGYLGIAFTLTILVNGVIGILLVCVEGIIGRLFNRRVYYR